MRQYLAVLSSEITATTLPGLMKSYSSRSFILDLQGRQWSCDTCWTYTMSVNISSSGSHIVRPEAEELPCQSGAQMWNLIEVGTPCRRRWAPAKARPGIRHTLPSKACGYNTEQMSACLCSAPLAPDFFCCSLKGKTLRENQNNIFYVILILPHAFGASVVHLRKFFLSGQTPSTIVTPWHKKLVFNSQKRKL